jgi:hypothetical protein
LFDAIALPSTTAVGGRSSCESDLRIEHDRATNSLTLELVTTGQVARSVYDLAPTDLGGFEARKGFGFQDHIAATFCIDMLTDPKLEEVWCETLDDIVLIWSVNAAKSVEFVQVKGGEADQLWSVSMLCRSEMQADGPGLSILEKSLAQDRCKESCRFRMVTTRPVMKTLEVLTLPIGSPQRIPSAYEAIHEAIPPRIESFRSPNRHDYSFWTANTFCDVRHSEASVKDSNLLKLGRALAARGHILAPDQLDELYARVLKRVWDAARANPWTEVDIKRIERSAFSSWLLSLAQDIGLPTLGAMELMVEKMRRAGLPADVIASAKELVRHYRHEQLQPHYMAVRDQRFVEGEVRAILQRLKSDLDNGDLDDNGISFHALCLRQLESLAAALNVEPKPSRAFLQGCMYFITSRCSHRFRRVAI